MSQVMRGNLLVEWLESPVTHEKLAATENRLRLRQLALSAACMDTTDPAVARAYAAVQECEKTLEMFNAREVIDG